MKKFFKFLFKTLLVLILLAVAGLGVILMIAPAENRAEALKEMSDFASSKMPVKAETRWLTAEEMPEETPADAPLPDEGGSPDPYTDFTPAVIAKQDGITVTATGFKKIVSRLGKTTYELYFTVKNDTDKEIYMGSEDIYLDHCSCFCFCLAADGETYFDVPVGETKDGFLRITPKLDKYGLDADPQTAGCLLYYRTRPEDYGRGVSVHHHLNCAAIPLVPQAADVSPEPFGTKLFTCRGVDFYLLGAEPDDSSLLGSGTALDMLVVNNSGDDFWIDNGDATKVNGEPGKVIDGGYFSESVPAGGFCLGSFRVTGKSSELENVEFRLALRNLYSGEIVGRTRTALVTVK